MKILYLVSILSLFSIENVSACADTMNAHPIRKTQLAADPPRVVEEDALPDDANLTFATRFGVKVFRVAAVSRHSDPDIFFEFEGQIFSWLSPSNEIVFSVSRFPSMGFSNHRRGHFFHQLAIETRNPEQPNVRIFYAMGSAGNWVRNEFSGRVHRGADMPTSNSQSDPEALGNGISLTRGNAELVPRQYDGWLRTQEVEKPPSCRGGRSVGYANPFTEL